MAPFSCMCSIGTYVYGMMYCIHRFQLSVEIFDLQSSILHLFGGSESPTD